MLYYYDARRITLEMIAPKRSHLAVGLKRGN